ncbi:MAG: 3-oxoacyl-[acyl-carrier-protein] reductase [Defluviitaleaceae bacterium]|nr:3-oxoacyl-[acyl-carrier-protein] reductase [Defluviitaleaceae bacterium]
MKTALITGASRGIGRGICLLLSENGYNIIINYSGNEEAAKETEKICNEKGANTLIYKANVENEKEVERMFEKVLEKFGSIDLLVNNAGITKDNLIIRMSLEEFENVININLKGAFNCSKQAAKTMSKKRYGKIINISSVAGVSGNMGQANYSASKAGLIGLTKSMAKELAKRNICVNAIAPGFIETDMTDILNENIKEKALENIPLGRMGRVEEIAKTVLFLSNSDYITGQVILVDGGMVI